MLLIKNRSLDTKIQGSVPGEIIIIDKEEGILVKTLDDLIIIKRCKLEGKNETDGYILSAQLDLKGNDILGKK